MPSVNSPYPREISANKSREAKTDPYATRTTYKVDHLSRKSTGEAKSQRSSPPPPTLGPRFKCWNMWVRQCALELCHLLTVCFLRLFLHLQGWDIYAWSVDSCLSYYLTRLSWVSNKIGWEVLLYIIKVVPTWCLWGMSQSNWKSSNRSQRGSHWYSTSTSAPESPHKCSYFSRWRGGPCTLQLRGVSEAILM